MPLIINATATKPTPSTKLGITYMWKDNRIIINKVIEGGLLEKSGLKVGHEIIAVNGTNMEGLCKDEVRAIFASIETDFTITARPMPFVASFTVSRGGIGVETKLYDMKCNQHELPLMLEAAGVPLHKWREIYHLIESEMAEATSESMELDRIFLTEMNVYASKQMRKGNIGFGQESNHEAKVIRMTHQCAALANNATLAATDVLIRANALLAPHGITVSLYLQPVPLPKYSTKQRRAHVANKPCGLRFMSQ